MTRTDRNLHRVAHTIDRVGISAVEPAVAHLVERARAAGIRGVAVDVLADAREPDIARARAFGLVAERLDRKTYGVPNAPVTMALGA